MKLGFWPRSSHNVGRMNVHLLGTALSTGWKCSFRAHLWPSLLTSCHVPGEQVGSVRGHRPVLWQEQGNVWGEAAKEHSTWGCKQHVPPSLTSFIGRVAALGFQAGLDTGRPWKLPLLSPYNFLSVSSWSPHALPALPPDTLPQPKGCFSPIISGWARVPLRAICSQCTSSKLWERSQYEPGNRSMGPMAPERAAAGPVSCRRGRGGKGAGVEGALSGRCWLQSNGECPSGMVCGVPAESECGGRGPSEPPDRMVGRQQPNGTSQLFGVGANWALMSGSPWTEQTTGLDPPHTHWTCSHTQHTLNPRTGPCCPALPRTWGRGVLRPQHTQPCTEIMAL